MTLRHSTYGKVFELAFPDLSGEHYRDAWTDRGWSKELDAIVQAAEGMLLFIHPDQINEPTRLDEVVRLAQAAETVDGAAPNNDGTDPGKPEVAEAATTVERQAEASRGRRAWDPIRAPTDVVLVDLLQAFASRRHVGFGHTPASRDGGGNLPTRIGVVVSAWDLVRDQGLDPAMYVTRRLPLTKQYLDAAKEQYEVRYYGLSALGGDPSTQLEAIQSFEEPTDRIEIVGPDCKAHDITAPVQWLAKATP